MILVCFALENEARPFRAQLRTEQDEAILITGMGAYNAGHALRRWLEEHTRPQAVLTCGFAGGLDSRWPATTVLFEADAAFPATMSLAATGAKPARFYQSPTILITQTEKAACQQATGADAVEMESGELRQICAAQSIPSATVRVISDSANEDMPLNLNRFLTPRQTISQGRLLAYVACHPRLVPALWRFHLQTRAASQQLASVLVRFLDQAL